MIKKGDVIFKGCKALEDFNSGAGGSSGKANYRGAVVHVKIPDSPKCPIGEAAKAKGAKDRIATFNLFVATWETRIAAIGRCTIRDYMIPTTEFVLFDASPRVRQLALISPFIEGLEKTTDVVAVLDETGKRQFAATSIAQLRSIHVDAGIVHSDVKPPNTMVCRVGGTVQARVLDFDASYPIDAVPKPENYVGDPYYFPPEIAQYFRTGSPRQIGPKVDVFSLGLMLAELLAGERMPGLDATSGIKYPADALAAGKVDVTAWLKGRGVAEDLIHLLAGMLHPVPEKRITSTEADDLMASRHRVDLTEKPFVREEAVTTEPKSEPIFAFKGMKMAEKVAMAPRDDGHEAHPVGEPSFTGMKGMDKAGALVSTEPSFSGMKVTDKVASSISTEPAFSGMKGFVSTGTKPSAETEGAKKAVSFSEMKISKDRI